MTEIIKIKCPNCDMHIEFTQEEIINGDLWCYLCSYTDFDQHNINELVVGQNNMKWLKKTIIKWLFNTNDFNCDGCMHLDYCMQANRVKNCRWKTWHTEL